jgi:ferredoxin-NADP reductase
MSMLRDLDRREEIKDVVHLHSARTEDGIIFGQRLREIDERNEGFRLHIQLTGEQGRITPEDLDELCPDWRDREIYMSGPGEMLDAFSDWVDEHGDCDRLHMERFQPVIGGEAGDGEGGTITFTKSDAEAESDGSQPILVAGEEAGLELPFGCRMGVCHTCIGKLCSGKIRDLRTGEVSEAQGEMVRTCIHAPEGPIEIEL